MTDEKVVINSADGVELHSVLNRSSTDEVLVVFVHGLGGDWYRTIPHVLARYCIHQDISIARISLYPGGEGRELLDTTVAVHAQDVNEWVTHFQREYNQVVLVGHSLGCPAIYMGNSWADVSGVVHLDPSIGLPEDIDSCYMYNSHLNAYLTFGGVKTALPKDLVEERMNLDGRNILKYQTNQLLVFGGDSPQLEYWNPVRSKFTNNIKEVVIAGAGHGFSENDTMDEMCEIVIDFIKKIS